MVRLAKVGLELLGLIFYPILGVHVVKFSEIAFVVEPTIRQEGAISKFVYYNVKTAPVFILMLFKGCLEMLKSDEGFRFVERAFVVLLC